MQDTYVGDIGDYGKFGLLRAITQAGSSLSINWYKTVSEFNKANKQEDGKYIQYLDNPEYRVYDPKLFDRLKKIIKEKSRNVEAIKESRIVKAKFYDTPLSGIENREAWHTTALKKLRGSEIVFLDPDNGIETRRMMLEKKISKKHIRWEEIKEYYQQNQSVIIYQHQPRIEKNTFLKNILEIQSEIINADSIRIMEYSSYVNRFFIMLLHEKHSQAVESALSSIKNRLPKFCEEREVVRLS